MRRAILEKQRKVEELKNIISQRKTVMIANIEGVPASMLQELRKRLSGRAIIKVYKNVIIEKALEGLGDPSLQKLSEFVEGHPSAVILSDEDPLKLYREVVSLYEDMPLRPGKPSPVDVRLEQGPVPVPITALSELKAAGLPVRSVKGSVEIEKEITVVRKGEVVDERLARALEMMGVKPVRVYLRILAAASGGLLFTEEVLSIGPEEVAERLKEAARRALNLAYNLRYPTEETVKLFLLEAHQKAIALALSLGIETPQTIPLLLARAHARALSLASRLPAEALDENLRALVKASTSAEEEEKDEEGEERKEEEEPAAGLASLFG